MPDPSSLIWVYVSVLVVFVAAALIYDARRSRKSGGKSGGDKRSGELPQLGRVGRAILRDPRNEPVETRPVPPPAPTRSPVQAAAAAPVPVPSPAPAPTTMPSPPTVAQAASAQPQTTADQPKRAALNGEAKEHVVGEPAAAPARKPASQSGWSVSRILTTPSRVLGELAKSPSSITDLVAAGPFRKDFRIAEDTEFLPAALEILETPPSPAATVTMLSICGGFVVALLWSVIGTLDIHAVAQGKIQPSGRTKVVQPVEAGRVAAIRVENGKMVKEGDVLVELDPTDTAADLEALTRELESTTAEALRRKVAVESARSGVAKVPTIDFPESVGPDTRRRESDLMAAELAQLRSVIDGAMAQIEEKKATKSRLAGSIEARKKLIGLTKERIGMREDIRTRGAGSRALVIEAELQYENYVTTDASERGQLVETDASIVSLEKKLQQAKDQFIAEQAQKGVEADRKRERLEQELIKAKSKKDRTFLRAPTTGTVAQLEVSSLGQVVASGQSVLSVVPLDAPLEVEAMVINRDIGFVRPGQRATVKVEAFPFTRYGVIDAEVVKVSTDAVEDRNVGAMMDAASAARPQANTAPKSPGQNLVFPAVVRLDRRTMRVDGKEIPLTPGMTVTVEIKTGQRRAISYLLSPLGEILSTSVHER